MALIESDDSYFRTNNGFEQYTWPFNKSILATMKGETINDIRRQVSEVLASGEIPVIQSNTQIIEVSE